MTASLVVSRLSWQHVRRYYHHYASVGELVVPELSSIPVPRLGVPEHEADTFAALSRNYRACDDDLAAEVSELKAWCKELNSELANLKKGEESKILQRTKTTSAEATEAGDKSDEEDPEVQVDGEGESESF